MQYFGYSVNIIFVIVALLLFQRIFLFHVQFVNGMNTSYVQIRNELASEQLIKVQFQVAMSGRYSNRNKFSTCLILWPRRWVLIKGRVLLQGNMVSASTKKNNSHHQQSERGLFFSFSLS